ncbi:MAG: hypothetical protein ACPKM0_00465 [Pleomorphochaeta sp.]
MKEEILCLEKVSCPPFLDDVNLYITQGEIVGLIPINILGVDELIELICDGISLHYGYVSYNGKIVNDYLDPNPKTNNVVIIDKESTLIDSLSVYENLFVLRKRFNKHIINKKMLYQQAKRLLSEVDIDINPDSLVESLDIYEKVILQLVKAQINRAPLVILKDISSFVNEKDIMKLHKLIKLLSNKGMAFLYICNHHQEAFLLSHRCYLMKEGHMVKNLLPYEMTDNIMEHYSYVFNRSLSTEERKELYENIGEKEVVFTINNLNYDKLTNFNLELHRGETVVILDSDNTVIEDLSSVLRKEVLIEKGTLLLNKKEISHKDRRIAFIEKKPLKSNLFHSLSVIDNILFCSDHKLRKLWLDHRIEKSIAKKLENELGDIVYEKDLLNLDEVDLYKILQQKILFQNPDVLILVQPFSFLDLYQRIRNIEYFDKLKKRGVSIIILALSLSDTLQVADRLYFAQEGKIVNQYDRTEFDSLSFLHGSMLIK